MTRLTLRAAALAASLLCTLGAQAADATADFSNTSNPNGVWSYGWSDTLGDTFRRFSVVTDVNGAYDVWSAGNIAALSVGKARAGGYVCCGTVTIAPLTMSMHPGPEGQYAIVRFTAPSDGTYSIEASFWGQDSVGPTSTDVHVRTAAGDLFTGVVQGFGAASLQSHSGSVVLTAGQTLDFTVGYGPNASYGYDSTGFSASVSAVPEPATLALWLAGGALLLARRRRA